MNDPREDDTQTQERGRDDHQEMWPHLQSLGLRDHAAGGASEGCAEGDQRKQTLPLFLAVDVVGESPELGDDDQVEYTGPYIEDDAKQPWTDAALMLPPAKGHLSAAMVVAPIRDAEIAAPTPAHPNPHIRTSGE